MAPPDDLRRGFPRADRSPDKLPTGRQHLASLLGEEWPRYLGYFVSFAFIGGVWVAHSTVSHFIKAVDATLMRLNLVLLLFVSLLPFTTAILATHLFASILPIDRVTEPQPGFGPERLAVVIFGVNLTLAALMTFLVIRHVDRTDELAADDRVEEELRGFARGRRTAVILQALATVVGVFLPVVAMVVYLDSPSSSSLIPFGSSAFGERSGFRKLDELSRRRGRRHSF